MKPAFPFLVSLTLLTGAAFGAETPSVGQVLDSQFRIAEGETVGLVEAMPAGKFDFAQSRGRSKAGPGGPTRTRPSAPHSADVSVD